MACNLDVQHIAFFNGRDVKIIVLIFVFCNSSHGMTNTVTIKGNIIKYEKVYLQ